MWITRKAGQENEKKKVTSNETEPEGKGLTVGKGIRNISTEKKE